LAPILVNVTGERHAVRQKGQNVKPIRHSALASQQYSELLQRSDKSDTNHWKSIIIRVTVMVLSNQIKSKKNLY